MSDVGNDEWRKKLTSEQYRVMREKGTEPPFTGAYYDSHEEGIYRCAGCGNPLFSSAAKFDSGTGWPSYFEPLTKESVKYLADESQGMKRVEVTCGKCGAHLGHVFDDGPKPSGKRYCINSVCLNMAKKDHEKERGRRESR